MKTKIRIPTLIRYALIFKFIKRRFITMMKENKSNIAAVSTGIAAGLLAGYLGRNLPTKKAKLKKKANKAIHSMSNMLDAVNYMFK